MTGVRMVCSCWNASGMRTIAGSWFHIWSPIRRQRIGMWNSLILTYLTHLYSVNLVCIFIIAKHCNNIHTNIIIAVCIVWSTIWCKNFHPHTLMHVYWCSIANRPGVVIMSHYQWCRTKVTRDGGPLTLFGVAVPGKPKRTNRTPINAAR